MSRESEVASRLAGDSTLLATLTGGVHQYSNTGLNGISRETVPAAFSGGYLLPTALIKQRGMNPDFAIQDEIAQRMSVRVVVEAWLYADANAGYGALDTAMARIFTLLCGWAPAGAFPLQLAGTLDRMRDEGALRGSCMARMDWLVVSVLG